MYYKITNSTAVSPFLPLIFKTNANALLYLQVYKVHSMTQCQSEVFSTGFIKLRGNLFLQHMVL